jgi:hypothetical protein
MQSRNPLFGRRKNRFLDSARNDNAELSVAYLCMVNSRVQE